jgi:hypothetical protein
MVVADCINPEICGYVPTDWIYWVPAARLDGGGRWILVRDSFYVFNREEVERVYGDEAIGGLLLFDPFLDAVEAAEHFLLSPIYQPLPPCLRHLEKAAWDLVERRADESQQELSERPVSMAPAPLDSGSTRGPTFPMPSAAADTPDPRNIDIDPGFPQQLKSIAEPAKSQFTDAVKEGVAAALRELPALAAAAPHVHMNGDCRSAAPEPPPLTERCKSLLAVLSGAYPLLKTREQLAGEMDISEKTVGSDLTLLIDQKLAERPQGERKGVCLTEIGRELAKRLRAR